MTEGQKLANELAQAIINGGDKTAGQVAAINMLGMFLDNQAEIAQALKNIANQMEAVINYGSHINVNKVDR